MKPHAGNNKGPVMTDIILSSSLYLFFSVRITVFTGP